MALLISAVLEPLSPQFIHPFFRHSFGRMFCRILDDLEFGSRQLRQSILRAIAPS